MDAIMCAFSGLKILMDYLWMHWAIADTMNVYRVSELHSRLVNSYLVYSTLKDTIPKIRNKYSQKKNFYACVCEQFIYSQERSAYSAAGKFVDRSWEYINPSQTHECGNWDWGRTIPFLGIHKCDFRCSVQSALYHVRSLHSLQSLNLGENYQILGSSSRANILSNITTKRGESSNYKTSYASVVDYEKTIRL
jgi:hypothetical protein